MRLKVVSDGTSCGTKFFDAETGEKVDLLASKITFSIAYDDVSHLIVEFPMSHADIETDAPDVSHQLKLDL